MRNFFGIAIGVALAAIALVIAGNPASIVPHAGIGHISQTAWASSSAEGGGGSPPPPPPPTGGASCTLPWGGTIADTTSVTAYLSSAPAGACTSETRTCSNGSLSGSYTNSSCTAGCTRSCAGASLSCTNGSITTKSTCYTQGTCTAGATNGQTQTIAATCASGYYCCTQLQTCNNGVWSNTGSATAGYAGGTDCTGTAWGTITSGNSVTAYLTATPASGTGCTSQTRICYNGTLSGSYTATSCTVAACSLPWGGTTASGTSVTAYTAFQSGSAASP
ncbi:MAG: hypothetical protein HY052_05215 [Proteobacteria bacterium]|nr:hypothetical protein [Pseudomonadota bacterium]